MDEDLGARWNNGMSTKVKCTKEVGITGKTWVDTGVPEEVERHLCLRKETIPFRNRESRIGRCKDRQEVVLERSDSSLCGVASMQVRGHKLVLQFVFLQSCLEVLGNFIVEDVKLRRMVVT